MKPARTKQDGGGDNYDKDGDSAAGGSEQEGLYCGSNGTDGGGDGGVCADTGGDDGL
ncbi:hypothetical protein KSU1_C1476 [Candidatus Jettenia caeni]|uniref:Uncharacterized protein n=1 Tax=Candidatus Jettenia caeni TaxID=247490 RepID=I3IMX7_9BACT|nr:hypothetical protein [Candidatus Jettenia sp. AMX1]GAB63072.1 hypothetical protein KSU1_C1476 [Candidatus Jettenia caeni]GJQ44290.1 MAG: hypothetical protein JETCAE04_00440 [Candidatus Jettenia caeni]